MSIKQKTAVVLVSGGMDSALTAAYAVKGYEPAFLHVNYGQRTEKRELEAFYNIANYFGVKKRIIADVSFLKAIGGSSITDTVIDVSKPDLESKKIPSSYVPFRNANILSIAVSWAEVIKAECIFIGAVEEDSSGYPDCRKVFFEAYEKMISEGTKPDTKIKLRTPIINFSKKDIVLKSLELKSPIHLTWSCYKENEIACGECDSCALRLRGFQSAGIKDPIEYKKIINYS
jgi:7-cyano-7-deazaguanine synthase